MRRYVNEYLVPKISRNRRSLNSKGRTAHVQPLKMRPTRCLEKLGTKCAVTTIRHIPEKKQMLDPSRWEKQKLAQTRSPETFEQDEVLSKEISALFSLNKYCY